MQSIQSKFARAFCFSFALAGAISISAMTLSTQMVLAKNTNNSGNGNNGNHGNSGSAHVAQPKKSESGDHPSDLGALNAAHASANALLHANPNSRVGRIAVFRDAVLATGEIEADRDAAQAALDLLPEPARLTSEVQGDLDLAEIALGAANAAIALADDQAAYDQAVLDRNAIAQSIVVLDSELAANLVYDTAAEELAALEASLLERPAVERELLEAAANKPVTDAVEAAVEGLLGLN